MRELPCPYCEHPIKFSWADFVFLNNWGKSDLFCLRCKRLCTFNNATTIASFGVAILPIIALYILVFVSGFFSPPDYAKVIFALCAIPVFILSRAVATEKLWNSSKNSRSCCLTIRSSRVRFAASALALRLSQRRGHWSASLESCVRNAEHFNANPPRM